MGEYDTQQKNQLSRAIANCDNPKNKQFKKTGRLFNLNVTQCTKYIRGIKDENKLDNDIMLLRQAASVPTDEYNEYLSNFLDGFIFSCSRLNEGQLRYYAPVGYIIELVPNEENVLGNYEGDGNTSNPNMIVFTNWLKDKAVEKEKYDSLNLKTEDEKKKIVKELLAEYFKDGHKNQDPLGPGAPEKLATAEQNILAARDQIIHIPPSREIKYTESVVHLPNMDSIEGAYYNTNLVESTKSWSNKSELTDFIDDANKINVKLGKTNLYMINRDGQLKNG